MFSTKENAIALILIVLPLFYIVLFNIIILLIINLYNTIIIKICTDITFKEKQNYIKNKRY